MYYARDIDDAFKKEQTKKVSFYMNSQYAQCISSPS